MNDDKKTTAAAAARALVRHAAIQGLTVSGAESCTGGLIAKLITDVPGCSAVFCGACVTYTNEVKMELLGVSPALIAEHTEVSYACAEAMAEGARNAMHTDLSYATTGYAGPGGGTARDPVGTVYVGISTKDGTESYRLSLPLRATRKQIRDATAVFVLQKLLERAEG